MREAAGGNAVSLIEIDGELSPEVPKKVQSLCRRPSRPNRSSFDAIRNGHDFAIQVAIEDQLPVSDVEDIQVEMLPITTPPTKRDLRDRRGVLEWAFEAKPGESRDIKPGWRVRWPKDKSVQFAPES